MPKRLRKRHLRFACDDRAAGLLPSLAQGTSPEEAYDVAWAFLEQVGIEVITNSDLRPARSLGRLMFLPPRFYRSSPIRKVAWLRHELTHWGQVQLGGFALQGFRYLFQRMRWGIEVQCDRERMRVFSATGATELGIRREADRNAIKYRMAYGLNRIDTAQLERESERILLEAAGLR